MHRIRKGLDLPLAGEPASDIEAGAPVKRLALLGDDYVGMKPTMLVREGDTVKTGTPLFSDKKRSGVLHTSPGAGRVAAIQRGAKRKFEAVVIELDGDDAESFPTDPTDRKAVQDLLLNSGLWTALRTRPFSRAPEPRSVPHAIFVTAIESRPHAPDPAPIIVASQAEFRIGLKALKLLTDGALYVCKRPGSGIPDGDGQPAEFDGPHPAGLAGTHIHILAPASEHRTVWSIGYQDVIAIGRLATTGRVDPTRVISLSGPVVKRPRLIRTRLGACVSELAAGELEEGENRLVSGSVLDGRTATGDHDYLGRFHLQVSALSDHVDRPLLGWLAPGSDKFSFTRAFTSALSGARKRFALTTRQGGDFRPIIPIDSYERVMPLDLPAIALLKALEVEDWERCQLLGALELDEEDLALSSFVCPGKSSFGPRLRSVLTTIEKEG